ncbi:iron-siderophore ABC transporter substrate-binding protein [Achromobacter insuavis]|uniref:iron-siderophore ABC transporter substrate-binding protein n=1 Tax=Achromobacter insuavis TaxID=1287735 RepID=UPI003B9D56FD
MRLNLAIAARLRRHVLTGAAALALVMPLAACERAPALVAAEPASNAAPAGQPGPTATAPGFPVTLRSALGEAVIAAPPRRVVTLGLGADDLALALGVVPVGVGRADWGGDPDHYWPWVRAAIEARGQPLPERITVYPELDIEKIIALRPDVVLAPFSGVSPEAYAQLSRLVPVVAYPEQPFLTPVQTQVDLMAAALGKRDAAAALKAGIHDALAQAARRHPELSGKTFAYVRADLGSGNFAAYVAGDPRVDTLTAMGLTLAPSVRGLHASAGHFAHYLGFEHADALGDADILVSWFYTPEERDRTAALPLYASIPAVRRGSYVALSDPALVMASSSGTPLAVAWMLDRLAPQLAEAARRAQAGR